MSDLRNPGDAWVTAADGNRYWGKYGAAGLLAYDAARHAILLQHRVAWSDHGNTWGIPGGARHEGESAIDGAIRESQEEAGIPDGVLIPRFTHVLDRTGWTYTTLIADVRTPFEPSITDPESIALAWVPVGEVEDYELHPAFAATWPILRQLIGSTPTVVVDTANVVGSVPDGWWKDRRAAAERLRNRVERYATEANGIRAGFFALPETAIPGLDRAYPDWVLVLEGVARGISPTPNALTVDALDLGDDEIVAQVRRRTQNGERVAVVTADAELRSRVQAAGAASTRGPKKLLKLLPELAAEEL